METDAPAAILPDRLIWIDRLRGVAALAIVVFHYHHFYLADFAARPTIPPADTFPYAALLLPLYSAWAARAVELFWMISGVVFLHVYRERTTTVWRFAVARFARLYPLHLLTLLAVAALQIYSLHAVGHWQIYGNNDLKHFLLQLGLMSNSVSLSNGLSYNGPIWSVSLEVPVYVMFLALLPVMRRAALATSVAALIAAGFLMSIDLPLIGAPVFLCAFYFFFGCLLYHLFRLAGGAAGPTSGVALLCCAIGAAGIAWNSIDFAVAGFAGAAIVGALAAERGSMLRERLSWLGDLSYAVYLVHVPLQMLLLLVADRFFDGTRAFAASALLLPLYLAATLAVAHVLHFRFERPLGRFLNRTLAPGPRSHPLTIHGERP